MDDDFELDRISLMESAGVPLDEIDAALDEMLTRPGSELYRSAVEYRRVVAHCQGKRPLAECSALLDRYLALGDELPLQADVVDLACALVPELVPRYMTKMIAQLEADTSGSPRVTARLERLRGRRSKIVSAALNASSCSNRRRSPARSSSTV